MIKPTRALTKIEYVALGLIAMTPKSGYDIVNHFEDSNYSWSASPGSVYPMLKRLEELGAISSVLDTTQETRPRKIYSLTEQGAQWLDEWLKLIPKLRPFYEEREISMIRFQFMEARFTPQQTLQWLENYLDNLRMADAHRENYTDKVIESLNEYGMNTVYRQLTLEGGIMEQNALRQWLEMARARFIALIRQERANG
jgi:DNA-binding PadR family transcriptional regulator